MEIQYAFNQAVLRSDKTMAVTLLRKGVNINETDEEGDYPITLAIGCTNIPMLKWLIKNGADVNLKDEDGETPLHLLFDMGIDGMIQAVRNSLHDGITEMITILLENGADLSLKDSCGKAPLDTLRAYSGSEQSFDHFKDLFRIAVPDIDSRVFYE